MGEANLISRPSWTVTSACLDRFVEEQRLLTAEAAGQELSQRSREHRAPSCQRKAAKNVGGPSGEGQVVLCVQTAKKPPVSLTQNQHEQHAAVTEPDMGGLHDYRHPAEQDDFVAPVELVSFTRREAQRHERRGRRCAALLAPLPRVTPNGVVSTVVAQTAQFLE